ncbi:MAG: nitrate/nitrite transporter NrtS [Terriglobales bacterium]
MLWRSTVIAAVVGTVLTAINQGDLLFRGALTSNLLWKVPLTYAVPFVVATLAALSGCRVPPEP